jgi:hypothetical protein
MIRTCRFSPTPGKSICVLILSLFNSSFSPIPSGKKTVKMWRIGKRSEKTMRQTKIDPIKIFTGKFQDLGCLDRPRRKNDFLDCFHCESPAFDDEFDSCCYQVPSSIFRRLKQYLSNLPGTWVRMICFKKIKTTSAHELQ